MVVYSLPCDCSPWDIIHWVLFVCFIIIIIFFYFFLVMDPFLHCDHLNREEGGDYLTFLCFVACVFHGLLLFLLVSLQAKFCDCCSSLDIVCTIFTHPNSGFFQSRILAVFTPKPCSGLSKVTGKSP